MDAIAALEADFDTRGRVPEYPEIFLRWETAASEYRHQKLALGEALLDVAYGPEPRHTYDFFYAPADRMPRQRTAFFVHGGYWRTLDKSYFSHMAAGLNAHGFDVAAINYRLCPHVEIPDIVEDVKNAADHVSRAFGRKLLPFGHSAGAHLVSHLLATEWEWRALPRDLTPAGMMISGIYDLTPLYQISVNEDLRLTPETAKSVSTLLGPVPVLADIAIVVGSTEAAPFLDQNKALFEAWRGPAQFSSLGILEGANHFDVIDSLAEPDSALTHRLAEMG